MATDILYFDSATGNYISGQYKIKPDFQDFTFMRRQVYGITKTTNTVYVVTHRGVSSTRESRTITLTTPGAGQVKGITNDRRYLIGLYQFTAPGVDSFVKWDFRGDIVSVVPNREGIDKRYEFLCFFRRYFYTLVTNSAPNEVHCYDPYTGELIYTFPVSVSKITGGITSDRHGLWIIDIENGFTLNYSATGELLKKIASSGKPEMGIAFNGRYKMIGVT